ncbi:Aste57867_9598 [Aphanomyces stellatus]|uniref:Aste57867_9598 protein n=1 Tax=Aphanomyces stellatus TaxID=120398 RepID=A0A485KND9_9STRA|nr:hypothetical protein As57867_009560 [Aphanomyces stellatus]VFT86477.1 Aste57867_9598 [Aphanomyces stellatus]
MRMEAVANVYAAACVPDSGVDVIAFADRCVRGASSRPKGPAKLVEDLDRLIVPEASLKGVQDHHEKVRLLQLQVVCRLAHAAAQKVDPMKKAEKKELYSFLSAMAMKMDAFAMMSTMEDASEQSAFSRFVVESLASRFQTMLPKTFKWLYKTMEITAYDVPLKQPVKRSMVFKAAEPEKESNLSADCSIAKALQDKSLSSARDVPTPFRGPLFQEVVLSSSQPKSLPIVQKAPKLIPVAVVPVASVAPPPTQPARHTMVLKTPERPKRPPMKKRQVCVMSSPPLRKPTKRIGALMAFK